jgi:hypothetical protein
VAQAITVPVLGAGNKKFNFITNKERSKKTGAGVQEDNEFNLFCGGGSFRIMVSKDENIILMMLINPTHFKCNH